MSAHRVKSRMKSHTAQKLKRKAGTKFASPFSMNVKAQDRDIIIKPCSTHVEGHVRNSIIRPRSTNAETKGLEKIIKLFSTTVEGQGRNKIIELFTTSVGELAETSQNSNVDGDHNQKRRSIQPSLVHVTFIVPTTPPSPSYLGCPLKLRRLI